MLARVQHRVMLGEAGNHMLPERHARPREAEHGEIVRLGAAARENDFVRFRAEQRREPVARVVNRRARLAPRGVDARGVAEMPLKIRPHRRENFRRERRGGVVVEIDHRRAQHSRPPRAAASEKIPHFSPHAAMDKPRRLA